MQKRKLSRVQNVLAEQQVGYISSIVSFIQLCIRRRQQQRIQQHDYDGGLQQWSLLGRVDDRTAQSLAIQTPTQLACSFTLLKLLAAVRMRAKLADVDRGIRSMLLQSRQVRKHICLYITSDHRSV
jgi:hypothetical protein